MALQSRESDTASPPPLPAELEAPQAPDVVGARARGGALAPLLRHLAHDPLALTGATAIVVIAGAAAFAPLISPHSPTAIDVAHRLVGPIPGHWLGTDELGRDTLARLIYGGRVSLSVAGTSVAAATVAGVALGASAGLWTGWLQVVVMRLTDLLLGFPEVLLAIVLMAFLGVSLVNVVIAIGVAYTPRMVRITWSSVLTAKELGYVEAARAAGTRERDVFLRHILPNILPVLIVQITLSLANAILVESALSFLGLGVQPPTSSWGSMINAGQLYQTQSIWVTLWPGVAIMATVLGFNFLGDGIADALDPRFTRQRH